MTDQPADGPQPKVLLTVGDDLEFRVEQNDAVFRNGSQIVVPLTGTNVLKDLYMLMSFLADATRQGVEIIPGLSDPMPEAHATFNMPVPEAPAEVTPSGITMPPDTTDAAWDTEHPSDFNWNGFDIRGEVNEGYLTATISHSNLPSVAITMDRDIARWTLDSDLPNEDNAFHVLAAKAFFAWWEHNGLDRLYGEVPDWPVGLHVRQKDEWDNWGVVGANPNTPDDRVLILTNGSHFHIKPSNAEALSKYEPIPNA